MPKASRNFLIAAVVFGVAAGLFQFLPTWPGSDTASGFLCGIAVGSLFGAAVRWRMPDPCDSATPALRRRYLREFLPPMAGYVIALFVSIWLLKRIDEPVLRGLAALLPVPPIALALRAIARYIRDADELQQKIELQAVSFATALVSLLYLAAGLLQQAKVIDVSAGEAMIWVFPLVCLVYGIAKGVVSRRYG